MNLNDDDYQRAAALQQEREKKDHFSKASEMKFWLTLARLPDIGEDANRDFLTAGMKYGVTENR